MSYGILFVCISYGIWYFIIPLCLIIMSRIAKARKDTDSFDDITFGHLAIYLFIGVLGPVLTPFAIGVLLIAGISALYDRLERIPLFYRKKQKTMDNDTNE